jgi:alpha-tubulin suppressor-like RCC1 family protein
VPWTWKAVSVGSEVTCAIRDDGRLMCWGSASTVQLGDGVPFLGSPTTVLPPL